MDDELALLQRELASVQENESVQRLSERNVVQLVFKLIEQDSVNLVYTFTGKEFLTKAQTKHEILSEILANDGRARLDDISTSLKVDISVIHSLATDLCASRADLSLLASIEVVSDQYLDSTCKVWDERLQESGVLSLGEMAADSALPIELIQTAVKARLKSVFTDAQFKKGVLYTEDYVNRQKAVVQGFLSAVTQPISLASVAAHLELDLNNVETMAKALISEGSIVHGKLSSGEFVPKVFTEIQRTGVDKFFRENGLIDLAMLKKMKVKSDPLGFVKASFKDAIKLDTHIVSSHVFQSLEASVDECITNGSYLQIKAVLPPQLTENDCATLMSKLPVLKSKRSNTSGLVVFQDHFVVSKELITQISKGLKEIVEAAAEKTSSLHKRIHKDNQSFSTKISKKASEHHEPAYSGKKAQGSGKRKKGRRRKGDLSDDEEQSGQSGKAANSKKISGGQQQPIDEPLEMALRDLTSTDSDQCLLLKQTIEDALGGQNEEELVNEILSHFHSAVRTWFRDKYVESKSALHRGGAAKARKLQQEAEKMLEETYPIFQVYCKGIEHLWETHAKSPNLVHEDILCKLESSMFDTYGRKFLEYALRYLCALNNIEPEALQTDNAKDVENGLVDIQVCQALVKELPVGNEQKKLKELYSMITSNQRKTPRRIAEFGNQFATFAVDECSFLLRKLDKKTERAVVYGHRQSLLAELKLERENAKRLMLMAISLVIQQVENVVLPITNLDSVSIQNENGGDILLGLLPLLQSLVGPVISKPFQDAINLIDQENRLDMEVFSEITSIASLKDPRTHTSGE